MARLLGVAGSEPAAAHQTNSTRLRLGALFAAVAVGTMVAAFALGGGGIGPGLAAHPLAHIASGELGDAEAVQAAVQGLAAQVDGLAEALRADGADVRGGAASTLQNLERLRDSIAELKWALEGGDNGGDGAGDGGAEGQPEQEQRAEEPAAAGGDGGIDVLGPEDQLDVEHCLETCCWTYKEQEWAFGAEKGGRLPDEHDRINPSDLRTKVDLIHNRSSLHPRPDWLDGKLTFLTDDLIPCLQPSTIVAVEGWQMETFFEQVLPHITVDIIVVLMDGDAPRPSIWAAQLEHPRISHIFTMNCDMEASWTNTRYTCIPIGISQWHGQPKAMQAAAEQGFGMVLGRYQMVNRTQDDSKGFLVSFSMGSFDGHSRHDAVAVFCGNDTALGRFSSCGQRDRAQFYPDVRDHMFTVSPHGMGLDSYRTWEVLFLGGYPLLKRSTIDELYAGLPVWIVDDWSDVTIERARAVHRAFSQKQWSFERLYIGWYQRQMYERRLGRIKGKRIHYRSLTAPQQQQQETKEAQQQQPARR